MLRVPAGRGVHLHPRRVPPPGTRGRERDPRGVRQGCVRWEWSAERCGDQGERRRRWSVQGGLLPAPRCGRVHLRRRDRSAGVARRQARLAPDQAAVPGGEGAVRPPDDHQQCRDAGAHSLDRGAWRGLVQVHGRSQQLRQQADGRVRACGAPGCVRMRPGHPVEHAGQRLLRRHAQGQEVQGGDRWRREHGCARPGRVRCADGFRHRPAVQRARPRHGLSDDLRRRHRHGGCGAEHRAVLQARELRPVHSLPRGLGMAVPADDAHRTRRRQDKRSGPGARDRFGHGRDARHDDLRACGRQQLGAAHDHQQVPR